MTKQEGVRKGLRKEGRMYVMKERGKGKKEGKEGKEENKKERKERKREKAGRRELKGKCTFFLFLGKSKAYYGFLLLLRCLPK